MKAEHAFRLRESGLSYRQIASAMGLPEPSVRRLVSQYKSMARVKGAEDAMERFLPGFVEEVHGNKGKQALGALGEAPKAKTRHLVIPDTQVRPGVDVQHLLWAGMYAAEMHPATIIHMGDHWDLPSLSTYESRGAKHFEGLRYVNDIDAGNKALELFSEGMARRNFKPGRMVILRGNHENRAVRAVETDPKLEGLIGEHLYNDVQLGWEPVPFLKPINIDGLWYSHYWANAYTGRAYGGTVENILRTLGHGFTAGHRQGLFWGRRELATGGAHVGLIAGSFYQHDEDYKSYQGNNHWRGIVVKNEVCAETGYDPCFVSLDYLRRKFG